MHYVKRSLLSGGWKPLLLVVFLLLVRWSFLEQLDALAFDFALRGRGTEPPDNRIVIVGIDDGSLERVGSWPWPRAVQGRLFSRILKAGPRLLGVDILLPSLTDFSCFQSAPVVLATAVGTSASSRGISLDWQEPVDWEESKSPPLGHIHADKDLDGVCRSLPLSIVENGKRRWAFSVELARLFWGVEPEQVAFRGNRIWLGEHFIPRLGSPIDNSVDSVGVLSSLPQDHLLINSRGGPRTFPHISAGELLAAEEGVLGRLKDKIVLVGATAYSLGDHLATAFSGPSEMPGVEIHANALDTILNRRFLGTTSELQTLVLIALAVAWTWILMERTAGAAFLPFLLTLLALVGAGCVLFFLSSLWLPMASLVIAVVATGGLAQFSRHSALNRQMSNRFAQLSALLGNSSQPDPSLQPGRHFRSRSLEWKLEILANATDQALRLAQMKEEMVSFVTHELKTPISSISGLSELLLDPGLLSQDERRESLELIHQESERLSLMATDYLELARLEEGGKDLHFQDCYLTEIVSKACRTVQPLIQEKEMTLAAPTSVSENIEVNGNADLLTEVFLNLLANAIQYSPKSSKVTVSLQSDEEQVTVSVEDQGYGIKEEEQAAVFEKFFRGSHPESQAHAGSGLGLALVKRVIDLHGGRIELQSRLGKGSSFRVMLPRIRRRA